MVVTLEEAKLYLRVDQDAENSLITNLIASAESTVENILRHPITDYEKTPEDIKMAILYGVAYLYENRETCNFNTMTRFMRAILIPYREEFF